MNLAPVPPSLYGIPLYYFCLTADLPEATAALRAHLVRNKKARAINEMELMRVLRSNGSYNLIIDAHGSSTNLDALYSHGRRPRRGFRTTYSRGEMVRLINKYNTENVGIYPCVCFAGLGESSTSWDKVTWNAPTVRGVDNADFIAYVDDIGLKGVRRY